MSRTHFHPNTWYAYCFISEFVLIYPVYLIMMESSGIDPVGIASLLMIWSVSTLVFELPTGVIADLLPRKPVLLVAGLLDAVAFLCWFFWPSFWGFACGFVIWSFAGALASGTGEAYLYEVWEQPESFNRVYGRTEAIESAGVAAALLLGGFLARYGFDIVLLLSILGPLVSVLILWWALPDAPERPTPEANFRSFWLTLSAGLNITVADRQILTIVAVAALLGALAGVYEEYIGVLFNELEFNFALIGMIYAGVWLARAVGAYFAEHLTSPNLSLLLVVLTSGGLLWVIFNLTPGMGLTEPTTLLALATLLLFFAACAVQEVVFGAGLQHRLQDETRATVTSIQTLGTEGAAALVFLFVGWVAVDASWRVALTELTTVTLIVSTACLAISLITLRKFTHSAGKT